MDRSYYHHYIIFQRFVNPFFVKFTKLLFAKLTFLWIISHETLFFSLDIPSHLLYNDCTTRMAEKILPFGTKNQGC